MAETSRWWPLPAGLTERFLPLLRSSSRRPVAFLAILGALGLALLIWGRSPATPAGSTPPAAPPSAEKDEAEIRAEELAAVLNLAAGAGRVEVRLTLAASSVNQWEQNLRHNQRTVEERSQDGGVQITTEETKETTLALARRADGTEAPVERSRTAPVITGAIIVADGARDPGIRAELARAAAAYLGVGLHRIIVLPREVSSDDSDR